MSAVLAALDVPAAEKWTDTGLHVVAGQALVFEPSGEWTDWFVRSGPEGFERAYLAPFRRWRRLPGAPWFALTGALDRSEAAAFLIGRGGRLPMKHSGRLYVFANDVPWAYGNNSGQLRLVIREA